MINLEFKTEKLLTKVHINWKWGRVGYCYISFLPKNKIYLDILNINPKFQGKWYGRKFIEYLRQYGSIEWEFTYNSVGFYEKLGAKIKGNHFYISRGKRDSVDKWIT